ncbi:hypothetical protein LAZ67_2001108 [Cordylochernes scorpioides]|uniref:RanBP2-type domain-containing protein n=1 Tax=Cordylochernes scorpioides TaxID=51811 RepID=A0ABY6K3W2_9ARAC|nr:hypothetical protein LAZ67_2001108 [Cordylochernes scorpioides]
MDQRTCIKFCVKNEIKCADAFRMLTVAYGEATLDRSNVYRWYKMFSEGREDVNDEERAGRPSTSTTDEKINEVEKMILANRRITVREVAEDLNISIGSGVVHHEFLPQGRTVNKEYYLQVMRNLREAIRQKRPDLWKNKNWLLHHDNAPAHTSLLVHDFLAKNNTLMMPQQPYSPDLAPCDFFLFPKLKRPMKGRRYATLDEIKTASKEELKNIFKNDFLKCFEDWKNRWDKCIISHGDYFEGDKIGVSAVWVEARFAISGITQESTKFNYLVFQLEPQIVENLWDIIQDSQSYNKYTTAKNRLVSIFKESEEKTLRKLLAGLELGDLKPTQLLRKMRTLKTDKEISEKVLQTLWMDKMPEIIKNILVVSEEGLDKLAEIADKIQEMNPRLQVNGTKNKDPAFEEMTATIASLKEEIATLKLESRTGQNRRSYSPRPGQRSRSRPRKYNPSGKYCYFHCRFGNLCRPDRCTSPCQWKKPSGNSIPLTEESSPKVEELPKEPEETVVLTEETSYKFEELLKEQEEKPAEESFPKFEELPKEAETIIPAEENAPIVEETPKEPEETLAEVKTSIEESSTLLQDPIHEIPEPSEQGMDSKNTEEVELLYAEQSTDSKMEENLDAEQGTESKVEEKLLIQKIGLRIPLEGKDGQLMKMMTGASNQGSSRTCNLPRPVPRKSILRNPKRLVVVESPLPSAANGRGHEEKNAAGSKRASWHGCAAILGNSKVPLPRESILEEQQQQAAAPEQVKSPVARWNWTCEHCQSEPCVLCALPKLGNASSSKAEFPSYHCEETPSVECQQTSQQPGLSPSPVTPPKKHDVWFFTRPLLSHFISPKHLPKLNSKWTCDKCHFFNIPSTKQCIICESSKNSNVGSERSLFSYLFGASKKGELLHSKRHKNRTRQKGAGKSQDSEEAVPLDDLLIIEEDPSSGGWTCKRCTYENAASLSCCEICESPRKLNIPATLPRNSFSLGFLADIKSSFNAIIAPSSASSNGGNSTAKRSKSFSEVPASRSLNNPSTSAHDTSSLAGDNSSKMWTCTNCTFSHNPYWLLICRNCDNPQENPDNNNRPDNARNNANNNPPEDPDEGPKPARRSRLIGAPLADEWTCVKCTLINAASDNFCIACGGSKLHSTRGAAARTLRHAESWACSQCTFRNPLSASKCNMCGAGGASTWRNHTLRGAGALWECSSCTFHNAAGSAVCEMCQTSRSLLSLRPEPATAGPCQGETELMEELRAVEENDARNRWQHIVDYCKQVPSVVFLSLGEHGNL